MLHTSLSFFFFFFNDTATTEIYTLSLHDALPISDTTDLEVNWSCGRIFYLHRHLRNSTASAFVIDRKSTRLNSSHGYISYAVFCLKKKKKTNTSHVYPTLTTFDVAHHTSILISSS